MYTGVSSLEELVAGIGLECCSFRGSVVKLVRRAVVGVGAYMPPADIHDDDDGHVAHLLFACLLIPLQDLA